eukprot:gene15784-4763_t
MANRTLSTAIMTKCEVGQVFDSLIELGHAVSEDQQRALGIFWDNFKQRVISEEYRGIIQEYRLLEIGCGAGQNLLRLCQEERCRQVTGVDVSEKMVREAERLIACEGGENRRKARVEQKDYLDWVTYDRFEVCIAHESLYFMDMMEALVRTKTLLIDGGLMIIGSSYFTENEA